MTIFLRGKQESGRRRCILTMDCMVGVGREARRLSLLAAPPCPSSRQPRKSSVSNTWERVVTTDTTEPGHSRASVLLKQCSADKMSSVLPFRQCCGSVTFWYRSGSVPLTYVSGSGSCYFRHWPSSFFAYYLLFEKTFK